MEKSSITSIIIYSIIVVLVIASVVIYLAGNNSGPRPVSFQINNRTYQISAYAYTAKSQQKGLMNATVTNTTFMLFYFKTPAIYYFWMKDTYSPLDIIWLNYNSSSQSARVVYIANATPCVSYSPNQTNCKIYNPGGYANYVLEAKAGFAQASGMSVGSNVKFLFK